MFKWNLRFSRFKFKYLCFNLSVFISNIIFERDNEIEFGQNKAINFRIMFSKTANDNLGSDFKKINRHYILSDDYFGLTEEEKNEIIYYFDLYNQF